ncbi:MAG: helix-turn-helix transcriptional regulator [Pseudomonadota bacterium]
METSDRIQQRMRELGLKGSDVGKATGVSTGGVSQWRNGITLPRGENLLALARVLQCDPQWLLTGKEQPPIESNATWAGTVAPWDDDTPLNYDDTELPLLSRLELADSAGHYDPANHSDAKRIRFSKSTLRAAGVSGSNAVCVTVSGDSMEPVLPDGATVGVDMSDTTIKNGKTYALRHGDTLRIKVLYNRQPRGLRLRSHNIDEYPDEHFDDLEAADISIIGRVFWRSVLM